MRFAQAAVGAARGGLGVANRLSSMLFGALAYMLTFYHVPDKTAELVTGIAENPIMILLMINAVLLVLGRNPLQLGIMGCT